MPGVIDGSAAWPAEGLGPVVTIGNFDGVHRGHRTLLHKARTLADQLACPTAAYTFHPSPADVLRPGSPKPKLQSVDDRVLHLLAAGMDHVVLEPFSADFASHEAAWFIDEVLTRRLRASAVIVGWDFRFGRNRQGDFDLLCERLSVPVHCMSAHEVGGDVVSSTKVREAVKAGAMEKATRYLGRHHLVRGAVVHGDHRGRQLGFPTANVRTEGILMPPTGVYAVRATFRDGVQRCGVCNLGVRPTFGENESQLEVHVLDFSADVYGETAQIEFVSRIRAERKFAGVQALVAQIDQDVAHARELLDSP